MMEKEKAQIMFKLIGKNNWGAKEDRLEHFKRFPNLKKCIKELSQLGWINVRKKSKYTLISLNTKFKREIVEHIKKYMPYLLDRKF